MLRNPALLALSVALLYGAPVLVARNHQRPESLLTMDPAKALGRANVKVTLTEFGDFSCPLCRDAAIKLRTLYLKYPDDVRVVFKHFPIEFEHPDALTKARAAECAARQGKFWTFHDELFNHQVRVYSRSDARDLVLAAANKVGLNVAAFTQCVDDETFMGTVEQDRREAQKMGINSTPTLVLNGRSVLPELKQKDLLAFIETQLGKRP